MFEFSPANDAVVRLTRHAPIWNKKVRSYKNDGQRHFDRIYLQFYVNKNH